MIFTGSSFSLSELTFEFLDPAGALLMLFLHLVVLDFNLSACCVEVFILKLRGGDNAL